MLHLTTLIYICICVSLSNTHAHTYTHTHTYAHTYLMPFYLFFSISSIYETTFFFFLTCHSKWIIEFFTFVNEEKKRKTVNVVFKNKEKILFHMGNAQTQNPIPPVYIPHTQDSTLHFRPLQRTLPFEVQKVFVHTPALGRSRAFMTWMAGPPGAVGRKLPVRPTATPVLAQILRTLKGYDSYNSLLLPPRLPGEKLPPEVYEYFREIKRSKEEQMKVKYLETLAQENGENSTALEPLASLRYLYWEMNQLLNTR